MAERVDVISSSSAAARDKFVSRAVRKERQVDSTGGEIRESQAQLPNP
jgi:hypothetical protein